MGNWSTCHPPGTRCLRYLHIAKFGLELWSLLILVVACMSVKDQNSCATLFYSSIDSYMHEWSMQQVTAVSRADFTLSHSIFSHLDQ